MYGIRVSKISRGVCALYVQPGNYKGCTDQLYTVSECHLRVVLTSK